MPHSRSRMPRCLQSRERDSHGRNRRVLLRPAERIGRPTDSAHCSPSSDPHARAKMIALPAKRQSRCLQCGENWAGRCQPSDCRSPTGATLEAGIGRCSGSRPEVQALSACPALGCLLSAGYCHHRLDHELQPRRHHQPSAHSEASAPGGDECVRRHLNCSDVREHQVLLRA